MSLYTARSPAKPGDERCSDWLQGVRLVSVGHGASAHVTLPPLKEAATQRGVSGRLCGGGEARKQDGETRRRQGSKTGRQDTAVGQEIEYGEDAELRASERLEAALARVA